MTDISVINFRKRREKRLADRGYKTKLNEYRKTKDGTKVEKPLKPVVREDAPNDNEENNNGKRGGGGGHGNTRLPYGLCQRFGIAIEAGWTPKDAWDALAGKGITAGSAFTRLKQGKDPAKPIKGVGEDVSKPKEPKKTIEIDGRVFGLTAKCYSWDRSDPYRLFLKDVDGGLTKTFSSKGDMLYYLKEEGVEEIDDPDTGEKINPSTMEFPKIVMKIPGRWRADRYYSAVSIGMRDGRYTIIATDLDGKKKKIGDYGSIKTAKEYLESRDVDKNDVKLSPALKKYEAERTAWTKSDKVEYIVEDGKKYGDLSGYHYGYKYMLDCSTEDGEETFKSFEGKTSLMKYLKEQGVEKAKIDGEYVNPQEFDIPKAVATITGEDYQRVYMGVDSLGRLQIKGVDIEGRERTVATIGEYGYLLSSGKYETYSDFINRVKDKYDLSEDQIEITEDVKDVIEKKKEEDRVREERIKEFESKAVDIAGYKYVDLTVEREEGYSDLYRIVGYDRDGTKDTISSYCDMSDIDKRMELYDLNRDQLSMGDESIENDFNKFVEFKKNFESKAVTFDDGKFIDVEIRDRNGKYAVYGRDITNRERVLCSCGDIGELKEWLKEEKASVPFESLPMNDAAKKMYDEDLKVDELVQKGEYYKYPGKRSAYKDLYLEEEGEHYKIIGTDIGGNKKVIDDWLDYNDGIQKLEDIGVPDYTIHEGDKVIGRPKDGMRSVMLVRTPDGFKITAVVGKGERKEVSTAQTEEDAKKWLRDNNIDDSKVKTRGMNPNDDAPRTHTQKSLSKFDEYRMEKIEESFLDKMSLSEKQEVADMLTEVFAKGEYRVARSCGSFGRIIEEGYKSQVETGSGGYGAAQDVQGRKRASDKFFGHGGMDKSEYEKCGYLGLPDDGEDWDDSSHPIYGGTKPLTYTLRKDRVKDRMTYTWGDSLNTRHDICSAGYGGDKPTIEGLSSLGSARSCIEAIKAFKEYKEGKISYNEMFRKVRYNADLRYVELQFHGPVTVEDIEKVSWKEEKHLDYAFSHMDAFRRKNVIGLLQKNNVKLIYRENGEFKDAWEWLKNKYPSDFV